MAAPKRSKFARERDLKEEASLYLDGWTMVEIGEKLGLSGPQVWYDIKAVIRRWQNETTMNIDKHKARELMKLNRLERKYLEGWEQSKLESQRTFAENRQTADGAFTKTAIAKQTTAGDPRFLDGAKDCVRLRAQILSLIVKKIAPTTPDGKRSWTPDQVKQIKPEELVVINGLYERIKATPSGANGQNGNGQAGLN